MLISDIVPNAKLERFISVESAPFVGDELLRGHDHDQASLQITHPIDELAEYLIGIHGCRGRVVQRRTGVSRSLGDQIARNVQGQNHPTFAGKPKPVRQGGEHMPGIMPTDFLEDEGFFEGGDEPEFPTDPFFHPLG